MNYTVTIAYANRDQTYLCAGPNEQVALIYAGKVVEANADRTEPGASVTIKKDERAFGPLATVRDMITKAV